MNLKTGRDRKLQKICQASGSKCAIWVVREENRWEAKGQFGLTQKRQASLEDLLADPKSMAWVAGALTNGRVRSRKMNGKEDGVDFAQLYVFPHPHKGAALLVGADDLDRETKKFLQLYAEFSTDPEVLSEVELGSPVILRPLELGLEETYDLQGVLQQVLSYLVEATAANGAYIALRSGSTFIVRGVQGGTEKIIGHEIQIEQIPWLQSLVDDRKGVIQEKITSSKLLPAPLPKSASQNGMEWMFLPIVLGQRVTGLVTFWSRGAKFEVAAFKRAETAIGRTAYLVENAIVFAEAARYLQQLALVNELATAVSSGPDIDQVAQRVLVRLRRVFAGAQVALLILSADGERMREYGKYPEEETLITSIPVANSLAGLVIGTSKPLRIGSSRDVPEGYALPGSSKAKLVVPLRYRGKVIGALDLTSSEVDAFSVQDEQLLVMIASHLAGLVENVRLNDETRKRARNLSLIHQVVQKVVGLTETTLIAQVAADLMAEQFDYDFAAVLLSNDTQKTLDLAGIAGRAPLKKDIQNSFSSKSGLMGQVFKDGRSRVVENLDESAPPHPMITSNHGSEMCVLLQEGDYYIGVIDAIRSRPQAFTENDLVTLEALAGVLSSVIMNANRYQQLQNSVRQLEAARETALEIAGDLDLDILLRRVVRRARELIGARGAELALVDEQAEIVRTVVSENPWRDFTGTEVPFMSGVEGKVAVLGEPLVVSDYNNWSGRLYPERHMPYRSVAGIPLKLTGKVIGVLLVSDDRSEREFRPADLQMLEFFAAQASVFIRNARLYQEIQESMEAQRQAEMQLVRSARLAAVGEMAAGVAHELNNPLTTVAGFIELVLDELPEDASQRQDLELVLREAKRARGVVRRLLDFSRPTDNLRIRTDLNELVSEVLTLVQHLIRTNGVTLQVELSEDLPWIAVDPNQIKQVLLNLVHNALQAMPRGGLLSVSTKLAEREAVEYLTVTVRDNGIGIQPEHLERIFEPFFTTRPVGSGTGLGLSVSYGIVNEHGGILEVESQLGQGSCFTVWLLVGEDG
jgi:two-component system NtrC family sensor kinase